MRILVLGGTAFLSAETARQALAAGHDVTCLARGTASAPPDGATWLRADRSEGAAAYAAARGAADSDGTWDAVVDVSRDPDQAREALEALAGSARHWTFISSCSVYADHSVAGADEAAGVLAPLPPGTRTLSWSRTSPRTPPRSSTSATSRPGFSAPPGTGPPGC